MECGMEYEISEYEKELLVNTGFIVSSSDGDWYDTTALLWDDYKCEGEKVFRMFDLLLGRKESRL
jgi:hypothetical protein